MVDSVVTEEVLDRLKKTESSGDRFALHPKTKALGAYQFMPETAIMLHKQGVEFNPFNEKQSREAARIYLEQLVKQNNGDLNKALKQYGGFKEQDPSSYISKVTGTTQPNAPKDQFDLLAMKESKPTIETKSPAPKDQFDLLLGQAEQPKTQQTQKPLIKPEQPSIAQTTAQPTVEQTTTEPTGLLGKAKESVTKNLSLQKMFEAKQALGQGLGERVAGAIDTAYGGIVPAAYGAVVQGLARTANTPQRAEEIGQAASSSISQPIGKALGITGKENYQHPLGSYGPMIAKEVNHLFNVANLTPEQISENLKSRFGLNVAPEDIRNYAVIGSAAIPQALKEVAPVAGKALGVGELQVTTPAKQLQAQFEAKQGKAPAGSVSAAASQGNPYFGKLTGEERGGSEIFPKLKLTKMPTDVPLPEQQLRSQMFQEVLPNVQPRQGVVTGNENLLRNEHALANMPEPSPLGLKMKEQIANEQIGLSNFAEDRVNATGARKSFTNDEQRGNFVNDVAHGISRDDMSSASLTGYLNQAKKDIYESAFKNVGNNKINSSHSDSFFSNPQQLATAEKDGTLSFLNGAKKELELAKTVGFELPDGKIAPAGSVAAFDAVRKSNNAPGTWTPERANTIRKINQAIDKDIAEVADPALYKLGDKVHQVEKTVLGSNGFKRLFGEVDANGNVTSKVAPEKMLSTLNNLRKDEWRHIRDTFEELANGRVRGAPEGLPPVPPELMQAARAAVQEIDGALAREVYKAGAGNVGEWSSKKANNVMNSVVGQKIVETFPPDEVRKFHALNYVGQYTPSLKYEGAALQQRRVSMLEKNLPSLGATVGGTIGGYVGEGPMSAGLGAYVGKEIGSKLQARKVVKEEAKAVKKMEKEMKKATELGKTPLKNVGKE
jgi:hypothetical protein